MVGLRASNGIRWILTAWRLARPNRHAHWLINASPAIPLISGPRALADLQQRLPSAMIAAGLGVFSSQTMVDLYSAIYD